jgi:2-dehydropantoate 2-reductase
MTAVTDTGIRSVAVVGPGGVGGLLAALVAREGTAEVTVVGTPGSAKRLSTHPLAVRSRAFGDFDVPVTAATYLAAPVDVCLLAVKATQLRSVVRQVRAQTLGRALLVPFLNGVEHVSILREHYPPDQVRAGTIRVESTRVEPGVIEHASPFAIVEIAPGRDPDGRGRAVAELLAAAGLDVRLRDDETTMLWEKLSFLAPLALMTTHAQAPAGVVRTDHRDQLLAVIAEVADAARATGADVDPRKAIEFFDGIPATMESSMQRDAAAGRPTELEAIGGAVLRAASRHGVDVPVTAALVADLRRRLS